MYKLFFYLLWLSYCLFVYSAVSLSLSASRSCPLSFVVCLSRLFYLYLSLLSFFPSCLSVYLVRPFVSLLISPPLCLSIPLSPLPPSLSLFLPSFLSLLPLSSLHFSLSPSNPLSFPLHPSFLPPISLLPSLSSFLLHIFSCIKFSQVCHINLNLLLYFMFDKSSFTLL